MSRFEEWAEEVEEAAYRYDGYADKLGDDLASGTSKGLMKSIDLARKHGLDKPMEWRPWLVGEDMGIRENDMLLLNASWSLWPVVAMVCESETGLWICDPDSGVEFEDDSFTWMPLPTREDADD